MSSKKGEFFILSAPAGTGKTTLAACLLKEIPSLHQSISYTTRAPREGEKDGVHYFFISREDFQKKIDAGEFLEYAESFGDYYGTSKSWTEKERKKGFDILLVIDTQGARQVRKKETVTSIFLLPPSLDELERRLRRRATESADVIERRLKRAQEEMDAAKEYDFRVVNEDIGTALETLKAIILSKEKKE